MSSAPYRYEPDYAVPPGEILEEHLDVRQLSQAEFARRCGRSPKMISEIIAGKAPVEPATALQFEKVLGVDAGIWMGIETDYRLHEERQAEVRKAAEQAEWAKKFPIADLVKRGIAPKPTSNTDRVSALLSFFGVASVEAWGNKRRRSEAAYRRSPSFKSDEFALETWLRLGELEAERVECADYDAARFRQALNRVRTLTAAPTDATFTQTEDLCKEAGVALAIVRPLPKTALSGVARWLTPRKALIQLTARHMSDDQLWFSFFHEAAHLLLHSKKDVFVHEGSGASSRIEIEANEWASNFLVPRQHWDEFVDSSAFTRSDVSRFAEEQGIAPGIVVGRLQYEKRLPWSHLNDLKASLSWGNSAG